MIISNQIVTATIFDNFDIIWSDGESGVWKSDKWHTLIVVNVFIAVYMLLVYICEEGPLGNKKPWHSFTQRWLA